MPAEQDVQECFLDETESGDAFGIRHGKRECAKRRQLAKVVGMARAAPRDGIMRLQHGRGGIEYLALVRGEIEIAGHDALILGRPRMRSAMMLRWISAVPPAIVSL